MSNAIVSNVYRYVIDDVINQVRGDFEDMGIDDTILQELQRSWESKVARSRVANFGFKDDVGYYDEDGDNSNNNSNNNNNNAAPNAEYAGQASAASLANLATAAGRSQPQQPPQQQTQQPQQGYTLPPPTRMMSDPNTLVNQYQMMQPPLNNNHNNEKPQNNNLPELQLPGLPRPNIPQNDGANDTIGESSTREEIDQHIEDIIQSSQEETPEISFSASTFTGEPLALDSLPDTVKELMKDARERAIKAGALKKKTRISQLDGEDDKEASADNDEINSDLDDTDEDDEDGEGGEEIEHIILCLYDKVTRTKNKWKCILKDGIMLVNGRDYLFHRANGDFEW